MQSALHMNGALLAAAEGVGVGALLAAAEGVEHCLQLQEHPVWVWGLDWGLFHLYSRL